MRVAILIAEAILIIVRRRRVMGRHRDNRKSIHGILRAANPAIRQAPVDCPPSEPCETARG